MIMLERNLAMKKPNQEFLLRLNVNKEFSYKYYKYSRSKEENKIQAEVPPSILRKERKSKPKNDAYYSPSPTKTAKYGQGSQKKGSKYAYNYTSAKRKSTKKSRKIEVALLVMLFRPSEIIQNEGRSLPLNKTKIRAHGLGKT